MLGDELNSPKNLMASKSSFISEMADDQGTSLLMQDFLRSSSRQKGPSADSKFRTKSSS